MPTFITQFIAWLPMLANGAVTTATLCLVAMVAGFFVGIGVWRMAASQHRLWRTIAQGWVSLFRGTPVLAQLLLCFYLPGQLGLDISGFFAAVLALTLNTAAYQSQILKSGFAAISAGQLEAAAICGLSQNQILWRIQVPQVLRVTLPSLISELIDVIKASAVVSVIALTDLMRVAQQLASSTYQPLQVYLAAALVYLVLTSLLSLLGRHMERRWQREQR
ncbi:amino acid ABC transporter permease [Gibbsiella quercinecans]|uniref:amino acid ABC transporter permease n=1 Tax=Gibbsiella quercinecans TaxID=929813 RepID=UPI000EF1F5A5|nr:amino acid ABC transporter permease [Gibbsiella quercinecans]RLM14675.1 ABC transporter permease [Gibbsiella quercinecans]